MRKILSQSGFSLIQVLVATSIMGVAALGLSTFMVNQMRMNQAATQKLEMNDLKQILLATMVNPQNCNCTLLPTSNTGNSTPLNFDTTITNLAANPPVLPRIELDSIFGGCDAANNPVMPLATRGSILVGTTTGLRVGSVSLRDIQVVNPTANQYMGKFTVDFDPTTVVGPRAPVQITQAFTAVGPPNAMVVQGCISGLAMSAQQLCEQVMGFSYDATRNPPCLFGGIAARTMCEGFGGTVVNNGSMCRIPLRIPGYPTPFMCDLPIASNVSETMFEMYALLHNGELQSPALWGHLAELFQATTSEDRLAKIYEIAGVSLEDKRSITEFLKTQEFQSTPYLEHVRKVFGLGEVQARQLLTKIRQGMNPNEPTP